MNRTFDTLLADFLAFWQENLTGSRLASLLGVDRAHAHRKTVSWFTRKHEAVLTVGTRRSRKYRDDPELRPVYGPADTAELFRLLDAIPLVNPRARIDVPMEVVDTNFSSRTHVHVFRKLYAACARRETVIAEYQSRTRAFTMEFSPHTLVRTPGRPHFRGYGQISGEDTGFFTDFVPARVLSIREGSGSNFVGCEADRAWHRRVTLEFVLNPDLPDQLAKALRQEVSSHPAFSNDRLVLPGIRECVAPYFVSHLGFRTVEGEAVRVWLEKSGNDHTAKIPTSPLC